MLRKFSRAHQRGGLPEVLSLCFYNVVEALTVAKVLKKIRRHHDQDEFDATFGVDTARQVALSDLDVDSPNYAFGVKYQATPVALFSEMMAQLPIRHHEFNFIDFGSGKGRTLLLAAQLQFNRVIGVEFSMELHEIALHNVGLLRKTTPYASSICCECVDAADYNVPNGQAVYYFFHPFNEPVMRAVLGNLERSLRDAPRMAYLVYHSPLLAKLIDDSTMWKRYAEGANYLIWIS